MEKQEFLDLVSQLVPPRGSSGKIRLTLIRTFDTFFPKKLTNERYLQLKVIPIHQYYKIVLSLFNQREYDHFKGDFSGDVSFLALTHHDIDRILAIANASDFYLSSFRSGGNGQIRLTAPPDITGQNYLFNEIRNAIINGIIPYSLTFTNGKTALEMRTDLNIIFSVPDLDILSLSYEIFSKMVEEKSDIMDRIANGLIPRSSGVSILQHIQPITFATSQGVNAETILKEASRGFIAGRLENSLLGSAFFLFSQNFKSPFCRVTVSAKRATLIATPGSSVDDIIMVMDNLSAIGRVSDEQRN